MGLRRKGLSSVQSCLVLAIIIAYGSLFFRNWMPLRSSEDCGIMAQDLVELQASLLNCQAEVLGWDKIKQHGDLTLLSYKRSFLSECSASDADLTAYMDFTARGECPDDWSTVERLMFEDRCHTLPRRSCFASMPENYTEPVAYPEALWKVPRNENVDWKKYSCTDYGCGGLRFNDCANLASQKSIALRDIVTSSDRIRNFGVADVLGLKNGSLRVGLDVDGGVGCFAATMAGHGVTILTTVWNNLLPNLETIALRGLLGLHVSQNVRLPFFDYSLDLIHTISGLNNLSLDDFKGTLYDWDRVLRPGGIIWVERGLFKKDIEPEYAAILKSFNYKEHEWIEVDVTSGLVQQSVVIEKPF